MRINEKQIEISIKLPTPELVDLLSKKIMLGINYVDMRIDIEIQDTALEGITLSEEDALDILLEEADMESINRELENI